MKKILDFRNRSYSDVSGKYQNMRGWTGGQGYGDKGCGIGGGGCGIGDGGDGIGGGGGGKRGWRGRNRGWRGREAGVDWGGKLISLIVQRTQYSALKWWLLFYVRPSIAISFILC